MNECCCYKSTLHTNHTNACHAVKQQNEIKRTSDPVSYDSNTGSLTPATLSVLALHRTAAGRGVSSTYPLSHPPEKPAVAAAAAIAGEAHADATVTVNIPHVAEGGRLHVVEACRVVLREYMLPSSISDRTCFLYQPDKLNCCMVICYQQELRNNSMDMVPT